MERLNCLQTHLKRTVSITASIDCLKTQVALMDKEVVQLYIQDVVAEETPMIKSLKAFQKLEIKSGESVEIEFLITKEMLSYYKSNGDLSLEKGAFRVFYWQKMHQLIITKNSS